MPDKLQRAVIAALIRGGYTHPTGNFRSIAESLTPLIERSETFETLSMCVAMLISEGYINGEPFQHGAYPVNDYKYLHVTYKGLHYKHFAVLALARDAVRSFLCPIAVAVITTIITNCIIG